MELEESEEGADWYIFNLIGRPLSLQKQGQTVHRSDAIDDKKEKSVR